MAVTNTPQTGGQNKLMQSILAFTNANPAMTFLAGPLMQLLGVGAQSLGAGSSAKQALQQAELQRKMQEFFNKENIRLQEQGLRQSGQQFKQNLGQRKNEFDKSFGLQTRQRDQDELQAKPGMISQFAELGRKR